MWEKVLLSKESKPRKHADINKLVFPVDPARPATTQFVTKLFGFAGSGGGMKFKFVKDFLNSRDRCLIS